MTIDNIAKALATLTYLQPTEIEVKESYRRLEIALRKIIDRKENE